jgi:hypothetical protein
MIPVVNESLQKDTALAIQTNDNVPSRATRAARHAAHRIFGPRMFGWMQDLSRPSFRGLDMITDRALCGWLIVISVCVCWAAILVVTGSRVGPLDATAQMELLAKKLERTPAIPSETASEIARVIGQPWYDCRLVACSAQLADRNGTTRSRLENLLASNELAFNANKKRREAAAEVRH